MSISVFTIVTDAHSTAFLRTPLSIENLASSPSTRLLRAHGRLVGVGVSFAGPSVWNRLCKTQGEGVQVLNIRRLLRTLRNLPHLKSLPGCAALGGVGCAVICVSIL